jgi:hypothetical protein
MVGVFVPDSGASKNNTTTILGLDPAVFYGISGATAAILTAVASIAYRTSKRR